MQKLIISTLILLLWALGLRGQNRSADDQKERKSILTIGFAPYAIPQSRSSIANGSLTYQRQIGDNLVLGIEGIYQFTNPALFFGDITTRKPGENDQYHDVKAGINLDLKYFLKSNSFEGHYFSLKVNNLLTYTSSYSFGTPFSQRDQSKSIRALPMVGVYYGYRKNFLKSFFVDASIGVNPHQQPFRRIGLGRNDLLDLRITLGYEIRLGKRKRR